VKVKLSLLNAKGLVLLALTLLFLLGLGGGWLWWNESTAAPEQETGSANQRQRTVLIHIPTGTSAEQIGEDLHQAGLIRSPQAWKLWTRWLTIQHRQGGFQAGTYRISPNEPLQAIAEKIWTGDVVQTGFTIPEGWSLRQMAAYFERSGFFKAIDFLKAAAEIPRDRYSWLPQGLPHLEGFLYPDTYQLPLDQITPASVVQIMLDRFQQVALPIYQEHQNQARFSLLQWVTLASIVEKEAVIPKERPLIAGIFLNRLQQNIPLGSDPTVEYALGIQQTPDQPLTLAQVKIPSIYNTYLNAGLPPTPIASPGLASLEAVLSPEKTDDLYFVARYDGTHVFSRTLAEHEAAQRLIRDQREAQQPSLAR
jgi:UPF0755 protein